MNWRWPAKDGNGKYSWYQEVWICFWFVPTCATVLVLSLLMGLINLDWYSVEDTWNDYF